MAEKRQLLRGKYTVLRLTDESDAEAMVSWRNRPEIARWLYQWQPLTLETHLTWFRNAPQRGDLLITFDDLEGNPIGSTSIHNFDHPKTSAEWGRMCGAQVGGGPYMLEGSYLVNRLCFEALGFIRLWGHVATENERAWRLYQFLGWVDEGIRKMHYVGPHGHDDVRMIRAMREEFEAARPGVEKKLYGDEPPPIIGEGLAARVRKTVETRFEPR